MKQRFSETAFHGLRGACPPLRTGSFEAGKAKGLCRLRRRFSKSAWRQSPGLLYPHIALARHPPRAWVLGHKSPADLTVLAGRPPSRKKGEGDLGGDRALPGAASKLKPCRPARTGRGLSPRRTGGGERRSLSPQNSLCVTHSPQKREASRLYGSSSLLEADFSCLKPIASPELPGSHSLQLPKGTAKVPGVGEAAERRYLLDRKLGTV